MSAIRRQATDCRPTPEHPELVQGQEGCGGRRADETHLEFAQFRLVCLKSAMVREEFLLCPQPVIGLNEPFGESRLPRSAGDKKELVCVRERERERERDPPVPVYQHSSRTCCQLEEIVGRE